MTERFRPLEGGCFLEVKVTAEGPKALAKPYSYTRYFEKRKARSPKISVSTKSSFLDQRSAGFVSVIVTVMTF